MTLIAMAVYDTEANGRTEYTKKTIECILQTVDLQKHRFFIIDNASCEATKNLLQQYVSEKITFIINDVNVGASKAINKAWKFRLPGEHVLKIDNDVIVHASSWVELLEDAVARDPSIGIVGFKRKDLTECPTMDNLVYRTILRMLPHKEFETWIVVEEAFFVMGTCQLYNHALIDKIGGLFQPGIWGYQDLLASLRSQLAGFKTCYLPHVDIDHLEPYETKYCQEKRDHAQSLFTEYQRIRQGLIDSTISIYFEM